MTDKYTTMAEENTAVLKRQDKLIVDMQQKNELMLIELARVQEEVAARERDAIGLQTRLREMKDQRETFVKRIHISEAKRSAYKQHLREKAATEARLEQERAAEAIRAANLV